MWCSIYEKEVYIDFVVFFVVKFLIEILELLLYISVNYYNVLLFFVVVLFKWEDILGKVKVDEIVGKSKLEIL